MVETIIREMRETDFPSLVRLAESNYGPKFKGRLAADFWQEQQIKKEITWFVAQPDYDFLSFFQGGVPKHSLLGAIGISQTGDCAKLQGLIVDPKYSINGVGKKLISRSLRLAETLDINCIIGYARCSQTDSQEMLEEFGFSPWGFLPNRIPKLNEESKEEDLESLLLYGKIISLSVDETATPNFQKSPIKIDTPMKKIRITHNNSIPDNILSEPFLYDLLGASKNFYVEIEVPEHTPSHETMSLFYYEPRTFAPVALRPCPAVRHNMIRYASWNGEFPSENKLALTSASKAMYTLVKEMYKSEFREHYLELSKRFLISVGEEKKVNEIYGHYDQTKSGIILASKL